MHNLRALAAQKLAPILKHKNSLETHSEAFISELCYGTCRFYFRLDFIAKQLLKKMLKSQDFDIYALILMGIYQLDYMRLPDYAVLSETADAARALNKPWAVALINAVLRNYLRNKIEISTKVALNESAKFAHPKWLIEKIKHAYPNEASVILDINNQRAPMSLRVNTQLISVEDYLKKLQEKNITAEKGFLENSIEEKRQNFGAKASTSGSALQIGSINISSGIMLKQPVSIENLPGFQEGEVSVQDISAQGIVPLLELKPNQRILDACAAPGGKTLQILETEPKLAELIALDRETKKLAKVQENLDRFFKNARNGFASSSVGANHHSPSENLAASPMVRLIKGDASEPNAWWDGQFFDRILIDAPCSGTGVIRRHPDIKLLRTPKDILLLALQQQKILNNLWPLLLPSGRLVYATCSILPDENEAVIQTFLNRAKDAIMLSTCQILPNEKQDGFFYAVIQKAR